MQGIEHLAQIAGMSLIAGIWQGFVLVAVVGFCLRLVPKVPARLRFAIWGVVLVLIAALPFFERLYTGHDASAPMVRVDVRWSFAIAAAWMAVSLFRAVDLALHSVRLWSLRQRAVPVDVNYGVLLAGRKRCVEICTSDEVDRPSVIGFIAPRILIPACLYEQLSVAELEQIVLHEMEHLRRGDDWLNLLQKLSLVLLPLNPIVMWVERRLCFERELACDDGVLRRTGTPRAYATCLTSLAERELNRQAMSLALGMIGGRVRESELAQRVYRILRRETVLSPMRAWTLTCAVTLGLLGGTVGLARCPQLVSFVAPAQVLRAEAVPTAASGTAPIALPVDALGEAERIAFRDSDVPHMTLLTAMMQRPLPAAGNPEPRKARRVARPVAPKVKSVRQVRVSRQVDREPAQGWIVLSSWSEDEQPRMVLRVVDHVLPYAAVPTSEGWFLVQL